MKEVILRCDLYFQVSNLEEDVDLGTLKAQIARDLVSQVRENMKVSKEWIPRGQFKNYLKVFSENPPVFKLLFEDEAVNALK